MLKLLSTVFVIILSVTVLRKSYTWIQYFAILLVLGGLKIVASSDMDGAKKHAKAVDTTEKSKMAVGIICIVVA